VLVLHSPLHAIVDVDVAARAGWTPAALARAYLDGGARIIQLRAKRTPSGPLMDLCDALVELARSGDAAIIVNDRADLARMCRAAGVHVGQDDLSPRHARSIVGDAAVVGVSTHTVPQIDAAATEPVSYIAVGPVFGTRTKDTGYSAVGLPLVTQAVRRARGRPVVAIGGVTLDNAVLALDAGAAAVAVITDLLAGPPDARVRTYLATLAGR
jgi:thiamine-phosphate pyrophosphorylase